MSPMIALLRQAAPEIGGGALVFMLVSMGAVTALTIWCFARVLRGRPQVETDGTGSRQPSPAPVRETEG